MHVCMHACTNPALTHKTHAAYSKCMHAFMLHANMLAYYLDAYCICMRAWET